MRAKQLSEAEKMRRVPGIVFADGPCGRRARIAGTGLDVFEIIEGYQSVGKDLKRLRIAYHWLTPDQLQAALDYYAAFPEEIDARLAEERAVTPETLREMFPHPSR
jgi:uncharacterized protein (DUF433 family)